MRVLVALLAATALLAAGCGGSDKESAATTAADTAATETAATETESAATETSSESTETSSESTDTSSVDTNAIDDAMSAAGLSEGCKQVAAMSIAFANAMAAAGGGGAGSEDLEKAAKEYEAYAKSLPDEIRDAVTTLSAAYAKYAKEIAGLNLKPGTTPDAATIAKLATLAQSLDSQEIKDAQAKVTAWADDNCSSTGG